VTVHLTPVRTNEEAPMTQEAEATRESWQLDTTAAEVYEELFVPTLFRGAAEALLETARPEPGKRVLDVGCGTGIVGRLAADRVGPEGQKVLSPSRTPSSRS
jgi:16S rRNA G1207 methylase RsmC